MAVTGIGVITPAGNTVGELWESVVSGRSAVRRLTRFDPSPFRSQVGAEVDDFEDLTAQNGHRSGRLDRFSRFAVVSAGEALREAGLDETNGDRGSAAVYLGSALGGVAFGEEQHGKYLASGIRAVAPSLAISIFAGAAATNVAIEFGLRGPTISNANSCASGAVAIGEAFRLIRSGAADIALAGGVECPLAPLTFGAFSLIKAMSTRNDDPETSCRPFDRDRDGFVMGEGAAVLVLEDLDHARARGAGVHSEILGYACTNDAYRMTVPRPNGAESARAMTLALHDAGLGPDDIGYVNAHATGTRLGDAAEAEALRRVFGEAMPPVSGTKAVHGHALGASPAIEVAATVEALRRGFLPRTANLDVAGGECEINHVPVGGVSSSAAVALSNAFGFGGINASLVIGRDEG